MASAAAVRAGRAVVEIGADDKNLITKLRDAGARLKAFGQSINAVGQQMMGLGLTLLAPIRQSIKEFASFERWMARVGTITRINSDELAKLGGEAIRIGRDTIFLAEKSAQAMSIFAQAGFSAKEIFETANSAADLAAAAMYELEDTALIVSRIIRSMSLDTAKSAHVMDVLAMAVTGSTVRLDDLSNTLKYVGPLAETAAYSFETVAAAAKGLALKGIVGEMGGTALRSMMISLASKREEIQELLHFDVADQKGNLRPFFDIISDIEKAMSHMGTQEKVAILGDIFQKRQGNAMAALVLTGGKQLKEWEKQFKESSDNGGESARIAFGQINTVWGILKHIASSIEILQIAVGGALAPGFRVIAESINNALRAAGDWVKDNQETAVAIALVVSGLIALGAALIAFGVTVSVIGNVIALLGTLIGAIPFLLIAAGIAWIIKCVLELTGAWERMVNYATQKWQDFGAVIKETWKGITDAITAGDINLAMIIANRQIQIQWFKLCDMILVKWEDMNEDLTLGWQGFSNIFVGVWEEVSVRFGYMLQELGMLFSNTWKGIQRGAVGAVGAIVDAWSDLAGAWEANMAYHQAKFDIMWRYKGVLQKYRPDGKSLDQLGTEAGDAAKLAVLDRLATEKEQRNKDRADMVAPDDVIDHAAMEQEATDKIQKLKDERNNLQFQEAMARDGGKRNFRLARRQQIEELEKELADALAEAARKKAEFDAKQKGRPANVEREEVLPMDEDQVGKVSETIGTFNAFAIRGFAGASPLNKIADNTLDMKKNLKKILDKFKDDDGKVFV